MKNLFIYTFLLFNLIQISAQVGINTDTPEATLDVVSDNSGVLFPRLNNTEISNMSNAVEGMMVYNTSLECLMINQRAYNHSEGTDWRCLLVGSKGQLPENPFARIRTTLNKTEVDSRINSTEGQ